MSKYLAPFKDTDVDLKTAQHVVWLLGDENNGVQPGDYVTRLWRLITAADEENLEKLRTVYPGYVEAFEAAQRTSWGLDWLRFKVMNSAAFGVKS